MWDGIYGAFNERIGYRIYPNEILLKRNFDKELEKINGNNKYPEITILTLFCGRFHTLEPYFWSLGNLDYDKKKIHLVFYCSVTNNYFYNLLKKISKKIENYYASIKIIKDENIGVSQLAFNERSGDVLLHLDNIPKLYTKAINFVHTKYFFSFEDDQINPSHIIKRFLRLIKLDNIVSICGAAFDRHSDIIVAFDFYLDPLDNHIKGVRMNRRFCLTPVGSGGFGSTIFDMDKMQGIEFVQQIKSQPDLLGSDVCFGYQANKQGKVILFDWDIHSYHIDSKNKIQ